MSRKISFTGSTATGKKVMASAAETLKRVTLELGGNDAGIVLDDVDPKKVAPSHLRGRLPEQRPGLHRDQAALCPRDRSTTNVRRTGRSRRRRVVGDGLQQGTQIGPAAEQDAVRQGEGLARRRARERHDLAGGDAPDQPGYFIRPTIVRDITDGTRLVDEEQFGPILPVIKYTDPEDALAAPTPRLTGLVARSGRRISTRRPYDLADAMDSGTVWINKHLDFLPNIPFGGAKIRASAANSARKAWRNSPSFRSSIWPSDDGHCLT